MGSEVLYLSCKPNMHTKGHTAAPVPRLVSRGPPTFSMFLPGPTLVVDVGGVGLAFRFEDGRESIVVTAV